MYKNPYKIVPLIGKGKKKKYPVLGSELFPDLNSSIYISASTKSGKTTNIAHIILNCAGKKTKLYFFCSTKDLDQTYKLLFEELDKRGIEHEEFHHFIDEQGTNIIEGIIEGLSNPGAEEEKSATPLQLPTPSFYKMVNGSIQKVGVDGQPMEANEPDTKSDVADSTPKPYIEKIHGKKYETPRYMFIFDDLGDELRKKSVYQLLMKQRQYIAKTILSSQYINNLTPQSINQLDYCLIYGGHNLEQVKELHKKLDLSLSLPEFIELYEYATKEKYNFLWIDRRNMILKKNYDEVIYEK